jgi:RNA polymerase sigma-70 factor (ECF subfamily)
MDGSPLSRLDPYGLEVLALCRAFIWDRGDLDEALLEILEKARTGLPENLPDGGIRLWILRVAVLTVHGINRKRRPQKPLTGDAEADLSEELRLEESYRHLLRNPEQWVTGLAQPLRNALVQLSDLDRAVFLLRAQCELRYSEIAEALDIPVGTVMGSLVRSRIQLRRALAEQIHEV